ncbi:hypothetical protein GALL_161530 [mine drainage metagenome]|uniref:Uncharacterized protein n=1 Tax=mine drainage metagenome TaxID=410659 RepID=A0A1J5S1G9_9ZZZZ
MRIFLLLSFLIAAKVAVAADRQVGFIQQQPGHLDLVSIVESGKKTVAVIHRFSSTPSERMRPISKEEFEAIWAAFTGPAAAQYAFTPSSSDSMSDPRFYTIKVEGAKKPTSLRIPTQAELSKSLSDAIRQIRTWIDEKG